jgi:hypothetical protein
MSFFKVTSLGESGYSGGLTWPFSQDLQLVNTTKAIKKAREIRIHIDFGCYEC